MRTVVADAPAGMVTVLLKYRLTPLTGPTPNPVSETDAASVVGPVRVTTTLAALPSMTV